MSPTSLKVLFVLFITGIAGGLSTREIPSLTDLVPLIAETTEVRRDINKWDDSFIKSNFWDASGELLKTLREIVVTYNSYSLTTVSRHVDCLNEHMSRFLKGRNPNGELMQPPLFCNYIRDAYVHYDDEQKKNHRGRIITVLEKFKIILERTKDVLDRTTPEL